VYGIFSPFLLHAQVGGRYERAPLELVNSDVKYKKHMMWLKYLNVWTVGRKKKSQFSQLQSFMFPFSDPTWSDQQILSCGKMIYIFWDHHSQVSFPYYSSK